MMHGDQPLHFVINKFTEATSVRHSQSQLVSEYGFEGSRFASVQALIMAYATDRWVVIALQICLTSDGNGKVG